MAASNPKKEHSRATTPSLPAAASVNNRNAAGGSYRPIPPEVIDALLSLPTAGLQLPQSLLKQLLGKSDVPPDFE
ncbi:hypothetical protein [Xanthomonas nasturtii]|uniref:hypothetical protein n=1 Tax=Xanthomonas nasturtii TaxID=1843581 RepID=UPI002012E7FD|nr:hypothetical protein [Xanthomonas nasturtii]MCL1557755.1 hypothetical protein [Xanthomonas nasturtii]